jgi:hypothetical protein
VVYIIDISEVVKNLHPKVSDNCVAFTYQLSDDFFLLTFSELGEQDLGGIQKRSSDFVLLGTTHLDKLLMSSHEHS